MPTILRFAGLRVVIYVNDHRPAHVHVIGNGCEAVFQIHCRESRISLRENYGFRRSELTRLENELNPQLDTICREWEKIHGVE
jgi:hypothetical protein